VGGIHPRKEVNFMQRLLSTILTVRSDADDGQGLAEYALILALVAILSILALMFLGSQVSDKLSVIGNAM
jgi:Flp pilus assembly pilin Flp